MAHFNKTSPEYRGNGHYEIAGVKFMSIWAFKKKHGITPNSSNVNGKEGQELAAKGGDIHDSTPDVGSFDKVFIYKVTSLEEYYGV